MKFLIRFSILVLAWQYLAILLNTKYVPPLFTLLNSLVISLFHDNLGVNVIITLFRITLGFGFASIVGIVIGIFVGHFPAGKRFLDFPIHFMRSLPPPIFIPLGIIVLGWSTTSRIVIIAFGCCWPTMINTIEGIRNMDKQWRYIAQQFGYNQLSIIKNVVFPGILPQVFAGLKISLSISVIMVLISEMMLTSNGLGFYIVFAQRSFNINNLYIGIIITGLLGYLLNTGLLKIENRLIRWHKIYGARKDIYSVT